MPAAGTITLTQNSTAVTGSGTAFTAAVAAGGFIVATVGGTAYTLGVLSVQSNTALTLSQPYQGPTTAGLSYDYVPMAVLNLITSALAQQVSYAIRGLNLDKDNWQQVFSVTGNATINLPDGSSFTGPTWRSITDSLNSKAAAGNNNDITGLIGLVNVVETVGPPNPSGTTGAYNNAPAFRSVIKGRGGNASSKGGFFALSCGEQVGSNVYGLLTMDWVGYGTKYWNFYGSGNANAPGSWVNGSDERHKSNIQEVQNPLAAVLSWRGCTYDKKDGDAEVGLIAQDVEKFCPIAVFNIGRRTFSDGQVIEDFKSLNTSGVAAAYHTEAVKALFSLVELALTDPETALKHIDEIKQAVVKP